MTFFTYMRERLRNDACTTMIGFMHVRIEINRNTNNFSRGSLLGMSSLLAHQVLLLVGLCSFTVASNLYTLQEIQDLLYKQQVPRNLALTNLLSQALQKHQESLHFNTLGASNKLSFSKAMCQGPL